MASNLGQNLIWVLVALLGAVLMLLGRALFP